MLEYITLPPLPYLEVSTYVSKYPIVVSLTDINSTDFIQLYPVTSSFGSRVFFSLERAAAPYFGIKVGLWHCGMSHLLDTQFSRDKVDTIVL